jgi:hypothetical protein
MRAPRLGPALKSAPLFAGGSSPRAGQIAPHLKKMSTYKSLLKQRTDVPRQTVARGQPGAFQTDTRGAS